MPLLKPVNQKTVGEIYVQLRQLEVEGMAGYLKMARFSGMSSEGLLCKTVGPHYICYFGTDSYVGTIKVVWEPTFNAFSLCGGSEFFGAVTGKVEMGRPYECAKLLRRIFKTYRSEVFECLC